MIFKLYCKFFLLANCFYNVEFNIYADMICGKFRGDDAGIMKHV